jgi:hypothetical protein
MASRKKQTELVEIWIQFCTADRRTHGCDSGARIVGHFAQTSEVDQNRSVAHAPSIPAMAAGAHRDCQIIRAGKLHTSNHIVNGFGEKHGRRKALRLARIEDTSDASFLILGLLAPDQCALKLVI